MDSIPVVEIDRLAQGQPPQEVLRWAAARFGSRVTFATGFGPEGCVLIDMIARQSLPIDIFTLDTGLLFPETEELWRLLESRYGVVIRAVRPLLTVARQAERHGPELWRVDPDACCRMRKVEPLRRELARFDAWITSIRRDQTAHRASASVVDWDEKFGLVKVNPLAAWTSRDVWDYIGRHDVPRNELHDRGYPSIGCWPCTTAVLTGEEPRAGRWRGRAKTECGLHARVAPEAVPLATAST